MALTLRQAAEAFRRYEAAIPVAILARLDKVAVTAQRLAVTQFMQGLGSGASAQPPNPPPGPLGIRSGNLRRAVQRIRAYRESTGAFVAGLALDAGKAPYAPIHEFGGRTRPHLIVPVKRKTLHWGGDPGFFSKRVNHPGSRIPARPVATPALELAAKQHLPLLEGDFRALEDRILGSRA